MRTLQEVYNEIHYLLEQEDVTLNIGDTFLLKRAAEVLSSDDAALNYNPVLGSIERAMNNPDLHLLSVFSHDLNSVIVSAYHLSNDEVKKIIRTDLQKVYGESYNLDYMLEGGDN